MTLALSRRGFAIGAAALAVAGVAPIRAAKPRGGQLWLGAWGAALTPAGDTPALPAGARIGFALTPSLSGGAVRLRVSNEHGDAPLAISAVMLRSRGNQANARFSDDASIVIPAGAAVVSDPVSLSVSAGAPVEVELTLPAGGKASSIQRTAVRKGGWSEAGGVRQEAMPALVSGLDVLSASPRPVLAILGDTKSAGPGAWPDHLTALAANRLGVVNRSVYGGLLALGAAGASALARFDRDVLATSGISHVLIFSGNNDLIQPGMIGSSGRPALDPALMQTSPQLIALLDQAARRARAAGLTAIGGTWLPYEGVTIAQGYSTPDKLRLRDEVNAWIRKPGSFDQLIDFDAALRDPAQPSRLDPKFDAGNHFTPNDAGYRRMAEVSAKALLG